MSESAALITAEQHTGTGSRAKVVSAAICGCTETLFFMAVFCTRYEVRSRGTAAVVI